MKTRLWACLILVTLACAGAVAQGTGDSGESPRADGMKAQDKMIESKLSGGLLTLYGCLQKGATAATEPTCKLPPSGTVEVAVKLTAGSVDLDQKLTAAGLTIKRGGGTAIVSGEIAISKLMSLVEMAEVSSVTKMEQHAPHLLQPR